MRPLAASALLVASTFVCAGALAGEPGPAPAPAPAPSGLDARIDAALAAPAAQRKAHVTALAAEAPAAIARLLERLAPPPGPATPAAGGRVLDVAVHFFAGTEADVAAALGAPSDSPQGVHVLEPGRLERLLDALEAGTELEVVRTARVSLYDRQQATLELLDRVSYVGDYELEAEGGATVANPVVSQATEGLRVEVRPTVSADGKHVTLALDVASGAVARPLEEEDVVLGPGVSPARVQRPEVHTARVTRTVTAPLGAAVLWAAPRPACATKPPGWMVVRTTLAADAADGQGTVAPEPRTAPETFTPGSDGEAPPDLPPPGGR